MGWAFGIRDADHNNEQDISTSPNRFFGVNGWQSKIDNCQQWDSAHKAICFMQQHVSLKNDKFFSWMKRCKIQLELL